MSDREEDQFKDYNILIVTKKENLTCQGNIENNTLVLDIVDIPTDNFKLTFITNFSVVDNINTQICNFIREDVKNIGEISSSIRNIEFSIADVKITIMKTIKEQRFLIYLIRQESSLQIRLMVYIVNKIPYNGISCSRIYKNITYEELNENFQVMMEEYLYSKDIIQNNAYLPLDGFIRDAIRNCYFNKRY